MTYIFELLHEKHYFEVLMRKKLDPVSGGVQRGEAWGTVWLHQNWYLHNRVELPEGFNSGVWEISVKFCRNKLILEFILVLV